jgi:formylmethanofuran:tetrahydromethanopterin formyltransferase
LLESPVTVALSVADLSSARDASEVVKLTVITLEALIVATAVALVVLSFAEVAVIVTVPPEGTVDGAVYVVAPPLAVFVGLKLPQPGDEPQLHVTPTLSTSFVTCALRVSVPDVVTLNVEGDTVTIIGRIVIAGVLADLVESATEVAVIVTVPHEGTVTGAVYVVPTVLCVCVGLKDP